MAKVKLWTKASEKSADSVNEFKNYVQQTSLSYCEFLSLIWCNLSLVDSHKLASYPLNHWDFPAQIKIWNTNPLQ